MNSTHMGRGVRTALFSLGFAVLLGFSWFLYRQARADGIEVQNDIASMSRELKQLDAGWNINILRARVGLDRNYDPLIAPLAEMHALRLRLAHVIATESAAGPVAAALNKLQQTFDDKEDLVEQFKSQGARLRNSLRYFPTAVDEVHALMQAQRPPAAMSPRELAELAAKVDRVLTRILRFNQSPDPELGERIDALLADIENSRPALPADLREPIELLVRHARIIRTQRIAEDAVLVGIVSAPTAQVVDGLRYALDGEFQKMLQNQQRYRTYLFAYSGLLLALLAYAAWRLMHSYQLLAQANRHLQAANETLEQRVAERTAELERQSAQLAELATHDSLTGLLNRRQFMLLLEQALQRAQRHGSIVAVIFIDLDGFKEINDTWGHAVGDLALRETASRIKRHVRKEDAFARLGGDEFVILINDATANEGPARVAQAALQELRGVTCLNGHEVRISASIGIGSTHDSPPGACISPETLLNRADHAMYQAKQQGKNCYCFDSDETLLSPAG